MENIINFIINDIWLFLLITILLCLNSRFTKAGAVIIVINQCNIDWYMNIMVILLILSYIIEGYKDSIFNEKQKELELIDPDFE